MVDVLVKFTVNGPQPEEVSFIKFAVTPGRVFKVILILSGLQPNGLVVTNFITTVWPGVFITYDGGKPFVVPGMSILF